jgi:hypothetical protein
MYFEMAHEFPLVGRVVVHLSDLAHFALVVSVLIGTEDAAKRFDACKLLANFVVLFELNRKTATM